MSELKHIKAPLTDEDIASLRVGDRVMIKGTVYTGRDAAHKRLFELIQKGEELPIELQGQIIYYVGPTPAKPGREIGSAGPTTSGRMDAYAPTLIERGLKAMIGKGFRQPAVIEAMCKHKAVYLAATGGAAALIARRIKRAKVVAYEDLGPEAIHKLEVEAFPVIVVNDCYGGDLYKEGIKEYSLE